MTNVAVNELQASFGEYLARVRSGEEVILTNDGVPVAQLIPLTSCTVQDPGLAALIRDGKVIPPEGPLPSEFWEREPAIADPDDSVLKALLEERESSW